MTNPTITTLPLDGNAHLNVRLAGSTITTLPGGAYLIQVGNRRSIVSSAHLVDERVKQLSRPGWGRPTQEKQP